jgi:DNA primase
VKNIDPKYFDFKFLKSAVSIEKILEQKDLLTNFKKRGNKLVGPCPIHKGDNPNAFVISLSHNLWHCFTQCNSGGDIIEFVRKLENLSYRETALYLSSLLMGSVIHLPQDCLHQQQYPHYKPFTYKFQLDPYIAFLQDKGILPSTAITFETGLFHGQGFLQECVGIRLHDPKGNPLGYIGRRLNYKNLKKYGKWKLPPNFPKNDILYNYHRIQQKLRKGIVVAECPWSVMRLAQINIPALALLGTSISASQIHLLAHVKRIILMLDGDNAGRTAMTKLLNVLGKITEVYPIFLESNKDPDDLSDDHLLKFVAPLIPF